MLKYLLAVSALLFSQLVLANTNCIVTSYQAVDQQSPSTTVVKGEGKNQEVVVTQRPPLRCAMVEFHTEYYQPRVANAMKGNFIATYVNGKEVSARRLSFPGDQVKTGYIDIGPENPAKAYVCFTQSHVPIESVECTLRP
ncbi:hypothetical protein M9194_07065 [Vibrio sp. S4M6]|uniref:hypothetical protein n=1 Tax=Vibrio sinus TaxID=2946865 RepID=UPI002029DCC5|nr:hypothetical protein [Vibrio sinus]MCL9781186.1 hypothetical protein [Vibrio sinus]